MKILLVTSLLVLEVFGEPVLTSLARSVTNLRYSCVVATDLVCPRDDITFWLYTSTTQESGTQLHVDSLDQAPWVDGPLKFLVHGYSVDKDTAINEVLRPAYFSFGEYNIISVDWSPLCRDGCYLQAMQNVPTVARCVADFFNAVIRARAFTEVHLLGHSMGGHVAAQASEQIPGLPRLTNTSCSHLRAVEYYGASIETPLRVFPCGGWQEYKDGRCPVPAESDLADVGEHADDRGVRGSYMAFTTDTYPFLIDGEVYTDKENFESYKNTVASECTIAYNYKRFVRDWF